MTFHQSLVAFHKLAQDVALTVTPQPSPVVVGASVSTCAIILGWNATGKVVLWHCSSYVGVKTMRSQLRTMLDGLAGGQGDQPVMFYAVNGVAHGVDVSVFQNLADEAGRL